MDVRCEKCQTEYELDEARLKPGGVTVKCTNCGHMFKIRKRGATNVGATASSEKPTQVAKAPASPSPPVVRTPPPERASRDSGSFDEPTRTGDAPADERQWLIRLENGEQKSCRELAVLQQWIIGGVVTREALISRTGKTWKRIGDITELAQYFSIADEARSTRQARSTSPSKPQGAQTMLGVGATLGPSAAGGTILPDDDDVDQRTTGNHRAVEGRSREATPRPPPPRAVVNDDALAMTQPATGPHVTRRPTTQPPPPPVKADPERAKGPSVPAGNRATAVWATDGVAPPTIDESGPAGPLGGKLKVQTEPAFAGRVRVEPGESMAFRTGGKVTFEDDEEVMPPRKGSKAGWIMLVVLLLVGGGAAAAYFVVFKDKGKGAEPVAAAPNDAAMVAEPADALATPPVALDAVAAPAAGPLELARAELAGDREAKLREALASISNVKDPGADALRAYLTASIAQQLLDRAQVTADKGDADKLKKEAKTIITDALGPAQKAVRAAPDDVTANLAMAAVLRVQGKSARDLKKYLDKAKAKATPELATDVALGEALVLARDGKLADAQTLLEPLAAGDDVRVPMRRALIAYAQNKPADARPLVDGVLAIAPDHATAKVLAERLRTTVVKTDPLPPEESTRPETSKPTPVASPGDSYDRLLAKANDLAERNCTQAMDLFAKALEQKPNGVEALTGMGYCHIDAKQFAAAYSKFRAALAVSPRYEPALWGVAETYLQQGRKEQALEAVKKYIDVHGETPKAKKALERLGATSAPATNPTPPATTPTPPATTPDTGSAAPATTPPPAPTPAPAPAPAADGAGSGSG